MTLSTRQQAHVASVFPECRLKIAEYLSRGVDVAVFRQRECGDDVPQYAVAPVEDLDFWLGCWDTSKEATANAIALGLRVTENQEAGPEISEQTWIDASVQPDQDGDYQCCIENNNRVFIASRRFKKGIWFGGCRPFSEADVVVAWCKRIIGEQA